MNWLKNYRNLLTTKAPLMRTGAGLIGLLDMMEHWPENPSVVEVGCYAGGSSVWFARKAQSLLCVDPFLTGYDPKDNASRINGDVIEDIWEHLACFPNVELIKDPNCFIHYRLTGAKFDVVYIDATHTFPALDADITNWIQCIKPGGIMSGHDYNANPRKGWTSVHQAVRKHFGPGSLRPETKILQFCDGSWLVKL